MPLAFAAHFHHLGYTTKSSAVGTIIVAIEPMAQRLQLPEVVGRAMGAAVCLLDPDRAVATLLQSLRTLLDVIDDCCRDEALLGCAIATHSSRPFSVSPARIKARRRPSTARKCTNPNVRPSHSTTRASVDPAKAALSASDPVPVVRFDTYAM